jgi:hypothetical protein
MYATWPAHLILLDLVTLIIFCEAPHYAVHPPITSLSHKQPSQQPILKSPSIYMCSCREHGIGLHWLMLTHPADVCARGTIATTNRLRIHFLQLCALQSQALEQVMILSCLLNKTGILHIIYGNLPTNVSLCIVRQTSWASA